MPTTANRTALLDRYRRNRRRTEELFARVAPSSYYDRPIALRNPICFYEGHLAAFAVNTLVKRALGRAGVDEELESLFERGIDPEQASEASSNRNVWPARRVIREFVAKAERRVVDALEEIQSDARDESDPDHIRAANIVLEHELMHQETLLYMWHELAYDRKVRPANYATPDRGNEPPRPEMVRIPAGIATLGVDEASVPFAWDNESPAHRVAVESFEIDVHDVTNRDYLEFIEARGYERPELWSADDWRWKSERELAHPHFWVRDGERWYWRGMFERIELPQAWPVYVSHAEACAFARWKHKRLPSEAEYHRAAFATPSGVERAHPWGDEAPDKTRGHFDFAGFDPAPVGSHPAGASAWGVHDLVGNGWEWTSTVFAPFAGFRATHLYPRYSADFFDGAHYVMKGASPATSVELVRRSLRNWFRPHYPYVYATFRCVR